MESGQQLQRGQTLVSQEGLRKMGNDLVELCNSIEQHGLVDYQYGVWEEQIVASRCGPFPLHECVLLTMGRQSWGSALICMNLIIYLVVAARFGHIRLPLETNAFDKLRG